MGTDCGLRPCQHRGTAVRGTAGETGVHSGENGEHLHNPASPGPSGRSAHRLTLSRASPQRSDAAVPPPCPPLTPAGPHRSLLIAAVAGTHLRRRGRSGTRGLWAVNATPLRRRQRPSGPGSDTGGRKRARRLRRRPSLTKGGAAPARPLRAGRPRCERSWRGEERAERS